MSNERVHRNPSQEDGHSRYITITGVLHPDNRLELEPGFVTDRPEFSSDDRESELKVEFLNETNDVLLRYGIAAGPVCVDGEQVVHWVVAAKVPYPPGARSLRFLRQDVVIHQVRVPKEQPVVRLAWTPPPDPRGEHVVKWIAEHAEGTPLRFLVAYSSDGGRSWRPLSPPFQATEFSLDFDRLPGGDTCLVAVTATDGFNTVTVLSEPFCASIKPCIAMILAPENGTVFPVGGTARFQGQGFYLEEHRPELEALDWFSSRDGSLGRGPLIQADGLSTGTHEIVLRAGTVGRVGESTVQVRVE
jgi:hypothetical protein